MDAGVPETDDFVGAFRDYLDIHGRTAVRHKDGGDAQVCEADVNHAAELVTHLRTT